MKTEEFVADLKLFTAMKLYEESILWLGKAAAFAGKSEAEFMKTSSKRGIAVIRYSKENLNEE